MGLWAFMTIKERNRMQVEDEAHKAGYKIRIYLKTA